MKKQELKEKILKQIKKWNEDDENIIFIDWNDVGWVYEIIKDWTIISSYFSWYVSFFIDEDEDGPIMLLVLVNKNKKNYKRVDLTIYLKTKKADIFTINDYIYNIDFTIKGNQTMVYKKIKKYLYEK